MLNLLFSWGKVHGEYIIANKFLKYYHSLKKTKGDCPWVSAFCAYLVELKLQKSQKGMIKFPDKIWPNQQPQEVGIQMKGAIFHYFCLTAISNIGVVTYTEPIFVPISSMPFK